MSEHDDQVAFFRMLGYHEGKHPELAATFAVPNGSQRHPVVAAKLQAEGVRPGVPDIFVAVARGGFSGLFLEMKHGKNKPTEGQLAWHARLQEQGYRVEVCYGWERAWEVVSEYLEEASE